MGTNAPIGMKFPRESLESNTFLPCLAALLLSIINESLVLLFQLLNKRTIIKYTVFQQWRLVYNYWRLLSFILCLTTFN